MGDIEKLFRYIIIIPDEILLQLTKHERATRNDDINNHIAEHCLQTKRQID